MKLRVTIDAQTFEVEVGDLNARPVLATIDGETFEVWPETAEETAAPLDAPASARPAAAQPAVRRAEAPPAALSAPVGSTDKSRSVSAPIPGVIIAVHVKAGDVIAFGHELCVLEAMKMKNLIRANRAGTIAKVCVEPGDQVRHGQVLLEFAD